MFGKRDLRIIPNLHIYALYTATYQKLVSSVSDINQSVFCDQKGNHYISYRIKVSNRE